MRWLSHLHTTCAPNIPSITSVGVSSNSMGHSLTDGMLTDVSVMSGCYGAYVASVLTTGGIGAQEINIYIFRLVNRPTGLLYVSVPQLKMATRIYPGLSSKMFVILILMFLVALTLVSLIYSCRYRSLSSKNRHLHGIPRRYPHLDPLFGLDLAVQTWRDFHNGELSEGIRRRHALYGRTFLTNNLCSDCIYTIEPENIRAVTTTKFSDFGKSGWASEAAKHVGKGVLLNDGEAWKRSRAMLRPIFVRTAADEGDFLEPHFQRLAGEIKRLGTESGGSFDFHDLACMFTLDTITEFLFGKSATCMGIHKGVEGKQGIELLSLVKDFEGPAAEYIAVGFLAWLGLLPYYRRLVGLVSGMKAWFARKLDEIPAEPDTNLARNTPRSVFAMMKAAGMSGDQIQGELQNIFFASYDTTSAFLANLLYVLVRHPDVQARLRDEIHSLHGRPPTSHELCRMQYLQLVIMEGSWPLTAGPQGHRITFSFAFHSH